MKKKTKIIIGVIIVIVLAAAGVAIYYAKYYTPPSTENAAGTAGQNNGRLKPPRVGEVGTTVTELNPEGQATFNHQVYNVTSVAGCISPNKQVEVRHIDEGGRILVALCRAPI